MRRARFTALSIVLTGTEPPSEFRIFTAGVVDTVKGKFTFDAKAADSVMAEYKAHGIDLMVDYDHASLGGSHADPALSSRAAGWFGIELRGGELWATNVRWCPPAAEALSRKEWRFMSPAFETKDGRITSLLNVALTNLPATRRLEPLMAASQTQLGDTGMTVEEFLKVLKALGIDPSTPIEEAMAKIKGEPVDEPSEDPPSDPALDELAEKPPVPPTDEEDKQAVAASISWLHRETGKSTISASIDEVKTWKESHLKLESETTKLAKERVALEASERKGLYVELVTAGRAPSTVWADDKSKKPKAYLALMSLTELREHVSEAKAVAPKILQKLTPPAGDAVTAHGLTERQLAKAKKAGIDPAKYAETLSSMNGKV